MKLLADHYLYRLSHFIPEDVQVEYYKPEEGFPRGATGYDAMLIRTVTPIHPDTLPVAGNLKFIGTATAGYDHVDIAHLNRLGIPFSRRSDEHTSELQSRGHLVCRLLLEKRKKLKSVLMIQQIWKRKCHLV